MAKLIPLLLITVLLLGCTVRDNIDIDKQSEIKEGLSPSEPQSEVKKMEILSSAFDDGDEIPIKYTCDDEDISPPLEFSDIPEEAKSLVLILDDPDAPKETWTHWLVFNIPVNATEVDEGKEPKGTAGENSWGKLGYGGPCPPDGEHKYIFKLFALDLKLDLPEGSNKNDVEAAMEGHILEKAELIGKYERK